MSSWRIRQLKRGTNVIIPLGERVVSMDVTFFFLITTLFSPAQPYLQRESSSEQKSSMDHLPILTTSIEHQIQQPQLQLQTLVDELCKPSMQKLRAYLTRQKSKTTPSFPCQTSRPDLGNVTSIPCLDSIHFVNGIDLSIAKCKEVRSCTQHHIANLFSQ